MTSRTSRRCPIPPAAGRSATTPSGPTSRPPRICSRSAETPDPLSQERAPALRPAPPHSADDAALMRSLARSGLASIPQARRRPVSSRLHRVLRPPMCPRAARWTGGRPGVEPALATGTRRGDRPLRGPGAAGLLAAGHARGGGAGRRDPATQGEALRRRGRNARVAAPAPGLGERALAERLRQRVRPRRPQPDVQAPRADRDLARAGLRRLGAARSSNGPCTSISLRDFYQRDGIRFGHVQSVGLDASYGLVVQHLKEWFDRSAGPGAAAPARTGAGAGVPRVAGVSATPRSSRGFSRIFPTRRIASFSIRRTRVGSASSTRCRTSCSHGARRSARCSAGFGAGSGRSSCTPNPS